MNKTLPSASLTGLACSILLLVLPAVLKAQTTFSEHTSLLPGSGYNSGVAMGIVDMNGDGLDDIVHFDQGRELNIEYQQAPNATFSNFNFGNISANREWSLCIGDVDQNGYNDILTGGSYNNIKLLRANSVGTNYTQSNLPNSNIFLQGSNFIDIDNDGWLDIFACHDDDESRDYRNLGNGTFVFDDNLINTSLSSGNSGNYASLWTDYDNDGDIDMYLSKCRQGVTDPLDNRRINLLFQNDGNNNFTEVGAAAGLRLGDQSWATDFADIDNDGDMDCFVINHYTSSLLFENNGDGTFTDITPSSGMSSSDLNLFGIQVLFRDFDNDGFVDLLLTGTEHRLFFNNGDKTFTRQLNPFGSNEIESVAVGDLNADGFLDLYTGYAGLFNTPSNIDDEIYINDGNSNNYFNVRLEGSSSNINGIGARLELYGSWGVQIRDIRSGEGYGIMNSLTSHFGIGTATSIDKLIVRWPSGTVDEVLNPNANSTVVLIEGSSVNNNLVAESGVLNNVSSTWQTVELENTYESMVVVATVVQPGQASVPAVARISNAIDNQFEIRVQNPSGSSLSNYTVHYFVIEEGLYTADVHGIKMEAVKQTTSITAENNNWAVDNQSFQQSYSNPVVLGQVMSNNDPAWSVFWASSASNYTLPPTSSSFAAGKHVGEDSDNTRSAETIAYIVLESGSGQLAGKSYTAALGPGTIQGVGNSSSGYNYNISPLSNPEVAILSAAGMLGNNGGWPVLFNDAPLSSNQMTLAFEEDQLFDTERNHIAEQVAYLVFDAAPITQTDQSITFDPIDDRLTNASDFNITASASSGLAVSFSILSGPASISGNTVTLDGSTGTVVIEANQAGDAAYNPAPTVSQSFNVSAPALLDQSISFDPIPNQLTDALPFNITATASSGLAVNFSIISGPASITGNTITLDGSTGTVVVEATQSGDAAYNPAPAVSQSFTITSPPTGSCPSIENLALNKPASQSGTQQGAAAERANDGNTSGNFWVDQSVSLTNWTSQAWWEVDLQQLSTIEEIKVWNRTDVNQDFLNNYYILVSDSPFSSTDLNTVLNQAGVSSYEQNSIAAAPTTVAINRSGRYVRIQLQGTSFLGLAEVEVMGCLASGGGPYDQSISFAALPNRLSSDAPFVISASASSGLPVSFSLVSGPATISGNTLTLDGTAGTVTIEANQAGDADYNPAPAVQQSFTVSLPNPNGCDSPQNLALDKPSTQVGTQQGAEASRANDGNTDGNFWVGQSVSLTNWTSTAWWEVDLELLADIQSINIWNRDDANIDFLNNYYVLVSDLPFTSNDLSTTLAQPGVEAYLQSAVADRPSSININRTGRYVRIQLQGTSFLGLAEVEVMGCPASGGGPYSQSISFAPIDDKLTTDGPFDLSATASSGLAVAYSIASGPASISGNTISLDGSAGIVTILATQAGDSTYLPATAVTQSFEVTEPNLNGCASVENLAINKPSTQSGIQQNAEAGRANDGNTDGNFWAGFSVSLTNWASESWWEVDLEADSYVEEVNIWNRSDANQGFLANYYVLVSDEPFSSTDLSETLNQAGVDGYLQTGVAERPTTVSIRRNARYVRIQLQGTSFLGLAEVEVMGCQPPPPPAANSQQWLYFDAQAQQQTTQLNWVSRDNAPGSQFWIERSSDGQQFEVIGEKAAVPDSQHRAVNYEATDATPLAGNNYYRIVQQYADGSIQSSRVKRLHYAPEAIAFGVFPNPAQERVWLSLRKYEGANAQVEIYNGMGQIMLRQNLEAIQATPYAFDLSEWTNGLYWITIKVEGHRRVSQQLLVQRSY